MLCRHQNKNLNVKNSTNHFFHLIFRTLLIDTINNKLLLFVRYVPPFLLVECVMLEKHINILRFFQELNKNAALLPTVAKYRLLSVL